MRPVGIELFGKLRFFQDGHESNGLNSARIQSLFAYLVLHPGPQGREKLAALLWPESSESQARTNLRQLLHNLRKAIPADCALLEIEAQTVRWAEHESCAVDVHRFEGALDTGDWNTAVGLYRDDLLESLYDDWITPHRDRLRLRFEDALAKLAAHCEERGNYATAIQHATRLSSLDPLRETYYQTLIRLHTLNGDRSSALRIYHQCKKVLHRELGLSPTAATQELFAQALRSDGAAPAPTPTVAEYNSAMPTSMVGRRDEWTKLLARWQSVIQGERHFALILGEPGIGKSRLAAELYQTLAGYPRASLARTKCHASHGRLAYAPVTEWLRSPVVRDAIGKLAVTQLSELSRLVPELLSVRSDVAAPQPLTESWQRRMLFDALSAAMAHVPRPRFLLIDDLQWCDTDTFEWLASFLASEEAQGTLVVGTARPEETGRDHPLHRLVRELRQSGTITELPIEPLSESETATLAAQIAGTSCTEAFLSSVHAGTKGNPLFVVESVRAAVEGSPDKIPQRVQAVISARLAQLSPTAYELAGTAAVLGRPFSLELLLKTTDWDEPSVQRALEELWNRRVIDGTASGDYAYTHDLLREVAYADLSPMRRRFLHRRTALALEEIHGAGAGPHSSWVAWQFENAGAAREAISRYESAAQVARARYADAESADHLRSAIRLLKTLAPGRERDERELALLIQLGPTLVTKGFSHPQVGETYHKALQLQEQLGAEHHKFTLQTGAWVFHIVRAELDTSLQYAQACSDWAEAHHSNDAQAAARFCVGVSLFHVGRLAEAATHLTSAARSYGDDPSITNFAGPDIEVFCRSYLSHALFLLGRDQQAEEESRAAVTRADQLNNPFSQAVAYDYALMLAVLRRDIEGAPALGTRAIELSRRYGFAYYLAFAEILNSWAVAANGMPSRGLADLRVALSALRKTEAELRLPFYYALLAEVCVMSGETGDALAAVASAISYQRKNGETWASDVIERVHASAKL